jgi:hypothetical protein
MYNKIMIMKIIIDKIKIKIRVGVEVEIIEDVKVNLNIPEIENIN